VSERAPEAAIWDALRGALVTRALAIAADLRVADALAAGPRPVADVARDVGVDADALHRILRALASDGIFAERERGIFENTAPSEALRQEGWNACAHLFGGVWHRIAGELDASSPEASFRRLHGTDFWHWLALNPGERAAFDQAMAQGWQRRVERLATLDWPDAELVVDVGGGNGTLLIELFRRRPGLRGIVFDLPETNRDEAALAASGIEFAAGDFFDKVPRGDHYVLAGILHDWDDERAEAILGTIRAAAPADARLVVIDAVVHDGNEPNGAKWLDLLLLGLLAGRERDEAQWRTLLGAGGFEPTRVEDGLIEARCL
jgi:O-methyltransferase domain/Dimerisation domain